jgi:hypothetical protein
MPPAPGGLLDLSLATWETWFKAWWAGHWTTDDLPGLRLVIRLYDRVARGDVRRLGELRQLMDSYGITPKGQQDRRWLRPEPSRPARITGDPDLRSARTAKERFRSMVRQHEIEAEEVVRSRDTRSVLRTRPAYEPSDG